MGRVLCATTTLVKSGMNGKRNANKMCSQPGSLA